MKNSIIIIIPYFGKLPIYFDYWLMSCKYNLTINWLLITDDHDIYEHEIPANVEVQLISFSDVVTKFQNNFNFDISLNKAYKFCDFRPAYGQLFFEDIKQYDFWGFGDIDLIYGDLRSYLTDEILMNFDKVMVHGHFSLMKNTKENNIVYKTNGKYKKVFSSENNFGFDEYGVDNYNENCKLRNLKIYVLNKAIADINSWRKSFELTFVRSVCSKEEIIFFEEAKNFKHVLFEFIEGKLFMWYLNDGQLLKREFMYVHFQKRKLAVEESVAKKQFLMVPDKFVNKYKGIDISTIKVYSPEYIFNQRRLRRQLYMMVRMFLKNTFKI